MADHFIDGVDGLIFHYPVDRGQQLQTKGRLETIYQFRYLVKASTSIRVLLQEGGGILDCSWHQLQLLVWRVAPVSIAGNEMPLNGMQYMAKILGIRTVRGFLIFKPQRLASFL